MESHWEKGGFFDAQGWSGWGSDGWDVWWKVLEDPNNHVDCEGYLSNYRKECDKCNGYRFFQNKITKEKKPCPKCQGKGFFKIDQDSGSVHPTHQPL